MIPLCSDCVPNVQFDVNFNGRNGPGRQLRGVAYLQFDVLGEERSPNGRLICSIMAALSAVDEIASEGGLPDGRLADDNDFD